MSLPIAVRPAAEEDLTTAHDWYESRQAGLGGEFQDAADATIARIRDNPELYAANRKGVRQAPIHRFPYVVYYLILDDAIEVFAVLHTRRHPRAWRSRL